MGIYPKSFMKKIIFTLNKPKSIWLNGVEIIAEWELFPDGRYGVSISKKTTDPQIPLSGIVARDFKFDNTLQRSQSFLIIELQKLGLTSDTEVVFAQPNIQSKIDVMERLEAIQRWFRVYG